MADWLVKKEELGGEFGYQIQVWEECRGNAVAFLDEADARLNDEKLSEAFGEAKQQVGIAHNELKAIVDTFLDPGVPKGKHDEYAQHLRKAYEAEKKAIGTIEAALKLMK